MLSLMKLDMANFTITAQRRVLNACSAEYERDKFAEYLKVNPGKYYLIIIKIKIKMCNYL